MGRSQKTTPPTRQVTSMRPTKTLRWVDYVNPREIKEARSKKTSLVSSKPSQKSSRWAPPGCPTNPCNPSFLRITEPRTDNIIPRPPDLNLKRDISVVPNTQWQGEELWPQLQPPWCGIGPISPQPEWNSLMTRTFQRREARPRPPNWGRWPPLSFLSPCMDSMAMLAHRVRF